MKTGRYLKDGRAIAERGFKQWPQINTEVGE